MINNLCAFNGLTLKDFAITGNGNPGSGDTKIVINGGTFKSTDGSAIYLPQIGGDTKITGGTFTGKNTAIEIRACKLDRTGGTFNATSEEFSTGGNGNGTTTSGAAIAVVQHTTQKDLDVSISGGPSRKSC